ncbi:MAG: hypothetical protein WKF62_03745 [Solirubrobacterales bacterium]
MPAITQVAANAPIGHKRMKAIRSSASAGKLVCILAARRAGLSAPAARALVPMAKPAKAATTHQPPRIARASVEGSCRPARTTEIAPSAVATPATSNTVMRRSSEKSI